MAGSHFRISTLEAFSISTQSLWAQLPRARSATKYAAVVPIIEMCISSLDAPPPLRENTGMRTSIVSVVVIR